MKRNFFDFLVLLIFLVFLIRRMFVYKKTTRWDLCGLVINYCHEVTDFAERGNVCLQKNHTMGLAGGDFEALHCQPSTNFDRSTKLDLTTEPPLLGRCCCTQFFIFYLNVFS